MKPNIKLRKALMIAVLAAHWAGGAAWAQTISFTGPPLNINFNSMGANGTTTPNGWFVGSNATATINYTTTVTASTGGTAVGATIRGFNLGTASATDRALGVGPTSSDRYIEGRFVNNTIYGLDTITIIYTGEEWRTGSTTTTNSQLVLQFSDDGVTYTNLGANFNFTQLVSSPATTALDGNAAANRTTNVGGVFTPRAPVAPGATFYLRWYDFNDSGTDPVLAIDDVALSATFTILPPSIVSISPTNGQRFPYSAPVTVTVTTAGTVSNVAFFVDSIYVTNDAATPFSAEMPMTLLPQGLHTITVIVTNMQGEAAVANSVSITITQNLSPTITITNVFSGAVTGYTYLVGSPITVQISVQDDAGISNVVWFVDGAPYGTNRTAAPYTLEFINPLTGNHTIQGIVTDRGGLPAASELITVTITNPAPYYTQIITNGADWKYYAGTNEPPLDGNSVRWNLRGYDDSTWTSGWAELGGGDDAVYPEKTVIDVGPATNRYMTIYFRKSFTVPDPAAFVNLVFQLLRDDGAVVYLNNLPVWTNNIPNASNSPVTYVMAAATASDDGTVYQTFNLLNPASYLIAGQNTLAVEVHQASATSSDLSFDLMLWGESMTLPTISLNSPTNGQAYIAGMNVTNDATASVYITNVVFRLDGFSVGNDATRPFSLAITNISVGTHVLTAVGYDLFGQSVTSAPVTIQVATNQLPAIAITNLFSGTVTGTTFLAGSTITNQVAVSDDLGVTNVEFFVDGVSYWRDTTTPFSPFIVLDALAGRHVFSAVATDSVGQTNTASVTVMVTNPPYTLLITNGANWKYLANTNTGLTNEWQVIGFLDNSWSNGLAPLGNDVSGALWPWKTTFDIGPANNRYRTVYFRRILEVANPAIFTNLILSVMRDDGAVVYINGTQVFATGFTNGTTYPLTYGYLAANSTENGTTYYRTNLDAAVIAAVLQPGSNVIAVEVHQSGANSSDLSFDLMLWGESLLPIGPRLDYYYANGNLLLAWPDTATGFILQATENIASPPATWTAIPGPYATNNGRFEILAPASQPLRFFNLRR